PLRSAPNGRMRESYLKDGEIGLKRWSRMIERAGPDFRLRRPSSRFRRAIGAWAGQPVNPQGSPIDKALYEKSMRGWIPSEADKAFVHSLMQKVIEPGRMAGWIAPPERGINN